MRWRRFFSMSPWSAAIPPLVSCSRNSGATCATPGSILAAGWAEDRKICSRSAVVSSMTVPWSFRNVISRAASGELTSIAALAFMRSRPVAFAGSSSGRTERRHDVIQVIHLVHAVADALVDVHAPGDVSGDRHPARVRLAADGAHVLFGERAVDLDLLEAGVVIARHPASRHRRRW